MNYIYDILLNLNKKVYDFYDWNEDDKVVHIKKVPIYTVDSQFIYNITNNDIIISKHFLEQIYKKTEIYINGSVKTINYLAIFSDGNNCIAIKFNKRGLNAKKSKFLIDEDIDINNLSSHFRKKIISYKIININNKKLNTTRMQRKCYFNIFNIMKNIDNKSQIKYLNYELFSIKSDSKQILINNIKKNFNRDYLKIYDFLKLIGTSK